MRLTVVGMLSGTSHDAIDAAVAELSLRDDTVMLAPRGLHSVALSEPMRARIAACLPPARTTGEEVCRLDTELGQLCGRAAAEAIAAYAPAGADLVVSHGQTIYHWVEGGRCLGTLQIGAPAWIAEATGTTVVSDLRSRDIARGGQGAPLTSVLDALLILGEDGAAGAPPRGALNLGGIANITVRGAAGIVAYDIGPAGALIDAAVSELTGGAERMDTGGARAARGTVDPEALVRLLAEGYYRLPAPKSTGKELFHRDYVRDRLGDRAPDGDDLLATLTELTARLVADACAAHRLQELVVSGGGVRNPALMTRIGALAAPVRVRTVEELGLPSQAKEAYLFALLGFLTVHGLQGTIASATGAGRGSILGSFTPGAGPLVLPEPWPTPVRRLEVVA